MRGRKPTPTALKVLHGNPGHRPLNVDEPQPGALDETCPHELADDALAVAEWLRAIVPAIKIGQVTAADRTLAVAHCNLWSVWQSQLTDASKHPHVVAVGPQKYPMPNPARIMANKTLQLLAQVDEKLGFSPTSRAKVQTKGPGSVRAAIDKRRAKFFALSRG